MEERRIFDKKFVYFMWDEKLKDKECFVSDDIKMLELRVENNDRNSIYTVKCPSNNSYYPISVDPESNVNGNSNAVDYRFVYYDPLYDIKWAWKNGKTVQSLYQEEWIDNAYPNWDNSCEEFRIKPEPTYRPFKSIQELMGYCSITDIIWIRSKANTKCIRMITGFTENSDGTIVWTGASPISTRKLFKNWEFLDGTPCGVKED